MADDLANLLKTSLLTGKTRDCEQFLTLAQPIVALAVSRALWRLTRPNRDLVDDLVQDTFAKLYDNNAHSLRSFRGDHSAAVAAWLRAVAGNVVMDWWRRELAKKANPGEPLRSIDDPGLYLAAPDNLHKTAERSLIAEQINRCLEPQKQRDRSIFWLYYRQGFTAKEISQIKIVGLGAKGVETTIVRVTKDVKECLGGSAVAAAG